MKVKGHQLFFQFLKNLLFSVLFLWCISFYAAPLVDHIEVSRNVINVYANKEFADSYLRTDHFFAEYDEHIDVSELDETIVTIPFIMDMMPMVWGSNKSWSIDAIDEDLYYSLAKIQKVFQFFYPSLSWAGELVPSHLVKNIPRALPKENEGVPDLLVLFSGGLDAVCTSIRHVEKQQLLVTICGSDIEYDNHFMWRCVQDKTKEYGEIYGHRSTFIRSNFAVMHNVHLKKLTPEIQNWWSSTMQSLGYTSLAAPIAAYYGCETMLIASTRTKEFPFPYGTHPLIDNAIACAGIHVIHDSAELDRVEKVEKIVAVCKEHDLPFPELRVCWGLEKKGGNCCRCEKCLRTMNELLVVGCDPRLCGFNVSNEYICNNTHIHFENRTALPLSGGLSWHWKCIQRYIRNKKFDEIDPEMKEHFNWVLSLPLTTCSHVVFTEDDQKLLADLWQQSCDGMLDYTKI